jgi:hypothetical protein
MTLPTRSAASLTDFLTSFSENYLNSTPLNQNFTNTPMLDHLLAGAQEADGGNELVLPVLDGYTPNGDSYGVGSTLNIVHTNAYTQARYQFKQVYESGYIDDVLWDRARGSGAKIDYVRGQLDRARLAIAETVAAQLCASSTGSAPDGSTDITSALDIIDSTGAIGGLNPATAGQTWWAATENSSVGSFTTNGLDVMRETFNGTTKYKMLGKPSAIFCSDTAYQAAEEAGQGFLTFAPNSGKLESADLGIVSLYYKGIPLVYEPHLDALEAASGGIMLWVNNKALKFIPRAGKSFVVDPWFSMAPEGKKAKATWITFVGELCAQARSPLAKLAGITA